MQRHYALIRKANLSIPTDLAVVSHLPTDLHKFEGQPVAFDFETHGVNPITGSIRSIAIANDAGCVAIDMEALTAEKRLELTRWLLRQKLIAHNAVFDAGWIYAKTGKMPKIEACTLVLFKTLATEGFLGQQWGLKAAMKDVLGWSESNEADLYDWLKANKLRKADMAKAPWDILGKYNALDAAGTWQLYKVFMETAESNGWGDAILDFHKQDFINLIELLIEQQIKGMELDTKELEAYDNQIAAEIEERRQKFLQHSEVKEHVEFYQQLIIDELEATKPEQYTKTGSVAARYTKWLAKKERAEQAIDFNIDSPKQLQWLLYERLYYTHQIKTPQGELSVGKKALPHLGELGKILKDYRELRDRRKFIKSLQNVQIEGKLHPNVKCHGTLSGRSSGGVE